MGRILMLILFICLASAAWPQAQPQWTNKIITFDAPGAGTGAGQGTFAVGIVQGGWIMGSYVDAKNANHGFLRAPDGTFTEFDAPDAGKGAGQGTKAWGMNPKRAINGDSIDSNNVYHAFVRSPDGKIKTFDAEGAGTGTYQGTGSDSINPKEEILGTYIDTSGAWHGYVCAPDGTITEFQDQGVFSFQGVFSAINPPGASVGGYLDAKLVWHGYLRARDGTFTEFDAPDAGKGFLQGTASAGINPAGAITGWYVDSNNAFHGFVRDPNDGTITEFDPPDAGKGSGQGTFACPGTIPCIGGINPAGAITGWYVDSNNASHGFLRARDGTITEFDVPDAQGRQPGHYGRNQQPSGSDYWMVRRREECSSRLPADAVKQVGTNIMPPDVWAAFLCITPKGVAIADVIRRSHTRSARRTLIRITSEMRIFQQ